MGWHKAYPLIGENPAATRDAQQHVEGTEGLPGQHVGCGGTDLSCHCETFQLSHDLDDDILLPATREGKQTDKMSLFHCTETSA